MCNLSAPHFHYKDKAREYLESIRWPEGPFCPHCGGTERVYEMKGGRPGLRKCGDCRKQFTVTVGTVFEGSKVPLNKWLLAVHPPTRASPATSCTAVSGSRTRRHGP